MTPVVYLNYLILTLVCMCEISLAVNGTFPGGDTISDNDAVTNQYVNLPYPTVTDKEIADERDFYRSDLFDGGLKELFLSLTLETMNHILYNGGQNFRYTSCIMVFEM